MQTLDEAGIQLKLEKGKIAHTKFEWLGYTLSESGVKPIDEKSQAKSDRLIPTTVKELRSIIGALNKMNQFIPNSAKLYDPLRPLFSKKYVWEWEERTRKRIRKINKRNPENHQNKTF